MQPINANDTTGPGSETFKIFYTLVRKDASSLLWISLPKNRHTKVGSKLYGLKGDVPLLTQNNVPENPRSSLKCISF